MGHAVFRNAAAVACSILAAACGPAKPPPSDAPAASSFARAELPSWVPGDTWSYTESGQERGRRRVTRRVLVLGDYEGIASYKIDEEAVSLSGTHARRARSVGIVSQRGLGRVAHIVDGRVVSRLTPPRDIQFPLSVGKKWTAEVRDQRTPPTPSGTTSAVESFEVVTYEPVTVRAGTFRAFKIVRRVGEAFSEHWYAPEVMNFVKSRGVEPSDPYEDELDSYTLAQR